MKRAIWEESDARQAKAMQLRSEYGFENWGDAPAGALREMVLFITRNWKSSYSNEQLKGQEEHDHENH